MSQPNGHDPTARLTATNGAAAELWAEFEQWAGNIPEAGTPDYFARRRAFLAGAGMMRRRVMIVILEDTARRRPLDAAERDMMERITLQLIRHKRELWYWHPAEDALIRALIDKRAAEGRPKPYTRNNEVRRIAKRLGRSYLAVHKRTQRLRNCPNANDSEPGYNGAHAENAEIADNRGIEPAETRWRAKNVGTNTA